MLPRRKRPAGLLKSEKYFYLLPVFLGLFLLGMGDLSTGVKPGEIPKPEKNFKAIVVDSDDIVTECDQVSINGKTILTGMRGGAHVSIPFNIISLLEVLKQENNGVIVRVSLVSGSQVEIKMAKDLRCYGRTEYGTFYIPLSNLKSVNLHHKASTSKKKASPSP